MLPYVVKAGEYLEKIAHAKSFDPDACWNDPKNKDLKDLRKDPNILCAGDVLYIPEPKKKVGIPVSIGSSNAYVATIPMVDVSLTFKDPGGGLANQKFKATGGADPEEGTSDGDGAVKVKVPVHVKTIRIEFPDKKLAYEVNVGNLDPIEEDSGLCARLAHLGYMLAPSLHDLHDKLNGPDAERLARAIKAFQKDHGLPETGVADDAFRAALKDAHGS